ncbi:hypothetical protein, partial [Escherichia coli]|uniref:hypothetical protein n=1 Tax=Escherichia coli TaxID=562 RepID=UPI001BC8383E
YFIHIKLKQQTVRLSRRTNTIPPLLFLKESLGGLLGWVVSDCVRVFMEWQTLVAVVLQKWG